MAVPISFDEGGLSRVIDDIQPGPVDRFPVSVNLAEISGGSTSEAAAQAQQEIEEFIAEGGRPVRILFGEHFIAGDLIVKKFTAGSPDVVIYYIGLGEGKGNRGGIGEWDSAVAVYYGGATQSVSPDGTTNGYRFYRGDISANTGDANQPVDAFLTGNNTYSGTAYLAIRLSGADATEQRADKVRGRYKTRRMLDFDRAGNTGVYGYSVNPARVAADRVFAFYQRRFGDALQRTQQKIDWDYWVDWKEYNDVILSWKKDGTNNSDIRRFEFHGAINENTILADALDQICAAAGAFWQDDGERLVFLPPSEREPVHHFDKSNIVVAPDVQPRDLRERFNFFSADVRDLDDVFLGIVPIEVRREELIERVGEIKTQRALPNMNQSQARRLLQRQARLEADNAEICTLAGDETSIHVLRGDFVTVSFKELGWNYQRCLVTGVTVSSAEDGVDTCQFTLQKINDVLYSDTDHEPRQEPLNP